jgi:gluconolactonase
MSFFAPPRRVETTVFTRLPDRFRKSRPSAWADANRGCLEIDSFLEGPSFDREGR